MHGKITSNSHGLLGLCGFNPRSPWQYICPIAIITAILALPRALSGQELQPLFGTWHLNLAESVFLSGPPQYTRLTFKIERWEDGLKVIYDMVGVRGGVTHWEWAGRLDGKDYALQGVEEVVTNAYRRIDAHTYAVITKVDGRITTNTKITISSDGKVMTVTSPAANARGQSVVNTAIYNRQ